MATIEGKGVVSPRPISIAIESSEMRFLARIAKDRDAHRGYRQSRSAWQQGSTADPILMGLVGEYAFQKFLRSRGARATVVDDSLNSGDGGIDATVYGVSYQIKTSAKSYGTCLVRRVSESKRIVPHVCDRFVFCRWGYGERHCDLRGWCEKKTVIELGKFCKGKRGRWFNNEIEDIHFSSMANLALLVQQEARNGK